MNIIKLYENCFITKGAVRSLIVDMQRDMYYFVPNSLANLFDDKHVFDPLSTNILADNTDIIQEYTDFLIGNELGFFCSRDMIQNFPVVDIQQWDYPASITNAVIEVDSQSMEHHYQIMQELTYKFFTRHLEVNVHGLIDCAGLEYILNRMDDLDLYSYNIIVALHDASKTEVAIHLIQGRHKVLRGIIHSATANKIVGSDKGGWGNIFVMKEPFSYKSCGIIDEFHFCTGIEHISESQKHNTCLNRKIMVNIDGKIKNCPGFEDNFGNIKNTSLLSVINNPHFNKFWKITKDDIRICRDCEFRHICTDCRAYINDPEDIFSKPLKCGYDPYTNIWEEWSTSPLKQSAINHYQI